MIYHPIPGVLIPFIPSPQYFYPTMALEKSPPRPRTPCDSAASPSRIPCRWRHARTSPANGSGVRM